MSLLSFPSDNIRLNSLAAQGNNERRYKGVILERNEIKGTNYDASLVLVEKASDGMLIEGLSERYLFKKSKHHGNNRKR